MVRSDSQVFTTPSLLFGGAYSERCMAKIDLQSDKFDGEERIMLGLLNAVHDNESLSQRSLANELSIALGLTNTYLKRCIKKGLIKVRQAPANRYAYYLTPHGFTEKTRLTAEYLTQSLGLFRAARREAARLYQDCLSNDWRRIVLVGDGDLAEIFAMSSPEGLVQLALYCDAGAQSENLADIQRVQRIEEIANFDAAIICRLQAPLEAHDAVNAFLPEERIMAPDFLGLDRLRRPTIEDFDDEGAI